MSIQSKRLSDEEAISKIKAALEKNPTIPPYTLRVKVGIGEKRLIELCEANNIKLNPKISRKEAGLKGRKAATKLWANTNDRFFVKNNHDS